MKPLTKAMWPVLKDVVEDSGNLERAFEHYQMDRPRLPFAVADKAFTKTLDGLAARGLLRAVTYEPEPKGVFIVEGVAAQQTVCGHDGHEPIDGVCVTCHAEVPNGR